MCPRTVCAPTLCPGSGGAGGNCWGCSALLGQNSHLCSTCLLLLSESLGQPEGGRKELLAHGDSRDTDDPGSWPRVLLPVLYRSELIPVPAVPSLHSPHGCSAVPKVLQVCLSVHLKTEKVFFKRMRRVRKTSNSQSPGSDGCTDNTALFSFGMLGMFCTAVSH